MATNVRFYRLNSLPEFVQNTHQGLFVYLNENITDGQDNVIRPKGLWFGGSTNWELLTNVQGITLQDVKDWMDNEIQGSPFTGEAEIFVEENLADGQTGQVGTKITIFDPILDSTGLHVSTEESDTHDFTVGDGALRIRGNDATTYTNGVANPLPTGDNIPVNDVHSANDVFDSTLELDNSLIWTPSGNAAPYGGTIGVRTNQDVTATNPVATMADLADLDGAMHLVGTLDATSEWPDQQGSNWITSGTPTGSQELLKSGDTFIVTSPHQGPDGQSYEAGDTVFYYESGNSLVYKVVNQNITTGKEDGQHAAVDMPGTTGLVEGKLVVATSKGIATTSNGISDFVTDVTSTQEITNDTNANETTYTVTTIVDRVDEGSDSNITTDTHEITFKSNNKSLTIVGDDANDKINFDLVWLTTLV